MPAPRYTKVIRTVQDPRVQFYLLACQKLERKNINPYIARSLDLLYERKNSRKVVFQIRSGAINRLSRGDMQGSPGALVPPAPDLSMIQTDTAREYTPRRLQWKLFW